MEIQKRKTVFTIEDSGDRRNEVYEKVCIFLMQKYYGGCEGFECLGISEGINGGTGRERIFYTSPENGRNE